VIGWRQWRVDRAGRLRPAFRWTSERDRNDILLWRPDGLTEAVCLREDYGYHRFSEDRNPAPHPQVPDERCSCGLYAWRSPQECSFDIEQLWTSLAFPFVVGVVRLGRRIVVAERGYRAQAGYPVAVLDRHGIVASTYPVARYRTWEALVAEWDLQSAA